MKPHRAVLALLAFCCGTLPAQSVAPLRPLMEIALPGVEGRIDHLSADVDGQRVFVSALGNGTVEIVDLKTGKRAAEITGLKEPQGVLFNPDDHRVYVASGGDGTLRIFDGQSLAPVKTLSLGDDADNIRYDSTKREVIVGYGSGHLASIAADLSKIADIKLPAHPESFQLDPAGGRVFVNLPRSFGVGVVDRAKGSMVEKWGLLPDLSNFPMALDAEHHRLFVGCRVPAKLVVLDTATGRAIEKLPTVGDTDDLFYDAARRRIYVIGGEGSVDVFNQEQNGYRRLARINTAAGARTGLFIPVLNRLIVAAPRRGSQQARLLIFAVE